MGADLSDFEPWLALWTLVPEGDVMSMPVTRSRLLPVRAGDQPAMLKLAHSADERRGQHHGLVGRAGRSPGASVPG